MANRLRCLCFQQWCFTRQSPWRSQSLGMPVRMCSVDTQGPVQTKHHDECHPSLHHTFYIVSIYISQLLLMNCPNHLCHPLLLRLLNLLKGMSYQIIFPILKKYVGVSTNENTWRNAHISSKKNEMASLFSVEAL